MKQYLLVTSKDQDSAPILAARFLNRPEVQPILLNSFVDWCIENVKKTDLKGTKSVKETGVIAALYQLFKLGKRIVMLPFAQPVLSIVVDTQLMQSLDDKLVKFTVKLVQRIGLTFLPVIDVSWCYSRNIKRIGQNHEPASKHQRQEDDVSGDQLATSDDSVANVPAEVEEVIEVLLCALRKESSIVRWSAAKGVGRIGARLPQDFAENVVEAILHLFSVRENGSAWQGACLTLAELGRRGLILPSQLPRVLDVIIIQSPDRRCLRS